MEAKQIELANELLQTASERLERVSGDIPAFNLLSALQMERLETRVHSRILFYLLSDNSAKAFPDSFLYLFLRELDIPEKFLRETWNVYREKAFRSGADRIDFVIESKSCCVMIEMKIDARDGDSQLTRYGALGRGKRKTCILYYLTPDGRLPEEQSAGGLEPSELHCISFKKEILSWLSKCMKQVDKDGYKYSFLKQYLGTVRHMTDTNDEVINVKDLMNSSDMAKAARLVADSFYEKMDEVTAQFFRKLSSALRRKTRLETFPYDNAVDVCLAEFTHRKHTYLVILFVEIDQHLVVGIAFQKVLEDGAVTLSLAEAEALFPRIYRDWMARIEALEDVPRWKHWPRSRYFILEGAKGNPLNFSDHSAQIGLIDEMDQECAYLSDHIRDRIIKPLVGRPAP